MEEFYIQAGGNCEEVVRRLGGEDRVRKLLGMMFREGSMPALRAALGSQDYETAVRAAHTLKGIVLNLGLARLSCAVCALTETLRPCRASRDILPQLARVENCYADVMDALAELQKSERYGGEGGAKATSGAHCR